MWCAKGNGWLVGELSVRADSGAEGVAESGVGSDAAAEPDFSNSWIVLQNFGQFVLQVVKDGVLSAGAEVVQFLLAGWLGGPVGIDEAAGEGF